VFLSPALDHSLRFRDLGSEPVEACETAIKALGDEARLDLLLTMETESPEGIDEAHA
jgi:hypothetical protein